MIPALEKDPQALSNLIALYDSEINFVDSYVGELIQKYSSDNNTLIIITSDHGEGFLEHGLLDHGKSLYSEEINIPLIIKLPKQMSSKSIEQQVSLLDIMPTVLSLLNLPIPEQALGKPLIALDGEEKNIPNRYLFSELGRGGRDMKAIFTDEWKYVYNYKLSECGPRYRLKMAWRENDWNYLFNYTSVFELLFNRTNDLEDKVNLVSDHAALGDKLKERLNQWVETAPKYPPKKVEVNPSQEIVDKLKSLGYMK